MPNITAPPLTLPAKSFPGAAVGSPSGIVGEALFSLLSPSYSTLVKSGKVRYGYATLTAPVIYTTAAGTGGPFLLNPAGSGVDAHIIAVSAVTVVASAVAGGLGFTGNTGGISASTAIDASGNALSGAGGGAVSVYRVATASTAGNFFMPILQMDTGALTVQSMTPAWTVIDGGFVVPQGTWGSVAASATLTTCQVSIGLVWAELPN